MKTFLVSEDVTLLSYIEAETPEQAIEIVKNRSTVDFDEIDSSPTGQHAIRVEEVSNG